MIPTLTGFGLGILAILGLIVMFLYEQNRCVVCYHKETQHFTSPDGLIICGPCGTACQIEGH